MNESETFSWIYMNIEVNLYYIFLHFLFIAWFIIMSQLAKIVLI